MEDYIDKRMHTYRYDKQSHTRSRPTSHSYVCCSGNAGRPLFYTGCLFRPHQFYFYTSSYTSAIPLESDNMTIPETMRAVILKESYKVAVEDVPTPKIKEDGDVLVKVHLAGLCGRSA